MHEEGDRCLQVVVFRRNLIFREEQSSRGGGIETCHVDGVGARDSDIAYVLFVAACDAALRSWVQSKVSKLQLQLIPDI